MTRKVLSIAGLLLVCSWASVSLYSPQAQSSKALPKLELDFVEPANLHDERKHFRVLARADALLKFGRAKAAAKIVETLPAQGPHSAMAQRTLTKAYWQTKQYGKIIRLLGKEQKLEAESALLVGASHLKNGNINKGLQQLRRLWWSEPNTLWSLEALRLMAQPKYRIYSKENSEIVQDILPGLDDVENKDPSIQNALLKIIDEVKAGDNLMSEVHHAYGLLHLRNQRFNLAVISLKESHKHARDNEFKRILKLHLGQALRHHGDFPAALALFRKVSDGHQDTYAEQALSMASETAIQYKEYGAAKTLFEQQIFENPVGETRQQALWGLGWIAYRQKEYAQAKQFFAAIMQDAPFCLLAPKALYWLGRISEAEENEESAVNYFSRIINSFPVDYYSFLARQRLTDLGMPPNFTPSSASQEDKVDLHPEVKRIAELVNSQMPKRAISAIEQVLNSKRKRQQLGPKDYIVLAKTAYDLKRHGLMNRAEKHRRERFPQTQHDAEEILSLYPQTYIFSITDVAKKERVEADLLLALAKNRSNFNSKMVAPTGELGLFQVNPQSAARLFEEIFPEDNLSTKALLDTEINAVLGARYMGRMWRALGKSLPLALAAYHAGPGLLTYWHAQNKDVALDIFIEELPYHHTQNFVRQVVSELARYRFARHMQETLERTTSALTPTLAKKSL